MQVEIDADCAVGAAFGMADHQGVLAVGRQGKTVNAGVIHIARDVIIANKRLIFWPEQDNQRVDKAGRDRLNINVNRLAGFGLEGDAVNPAIAHRQVKLAVAGQFAVRVAATVAAADIAIVIGGAGGGFAHHFVGDAARKIGQGVVAVQHHRHTDVAKGGVIFTHVAIGDARPVHRLGISAVEA